MREAGCGMRKGRRRSRARTNASRIPHPPSRRWTAPTRCSSAARRRAPTRPIPARSWRRTDGGSPRWVRGTARIFGTPWKRRARQRAGRTRGQILYYIAETPSTRTDEFAARIDAMTGCGPERARAEVDAAVSRLFTYASWADKYDGQVPPTTIRGVTLAMNEPIGVLGIAAPEELPLLGFVSLVAPAIAVGNTVVAIPSEADPLAATELYSVLETSDVPAGVINIVTGSKDELSKVLADHLDVDAMWYVGNQAAAAEVERASAGNMKRTWAAWHTRDWLDPRQGEGREFLREATQGKNIWIPYGE